MLTYALATEIAIDADGAAPAVACWMRAHLQAEIAALANPLTLAAPDDPILGDYIREAFGPRLQTEYEGMQLCDACGAFKPGHHVRLAGRWHCERCQKQPRLALA